LINKLLKSENEKDILIGLSVVKEFVRVPKITRDNQPIKDEVIRRTEEMLNLEYKTLSYFVDFSKVMLQKFNNVSVESNNLILEKDGEKITLPIKGNANMTKRILENKYGRKGLNLEGQEISISDLRNLPAIDFEGQKAIKDYIDDLVFALYFNIPLKDLGVNKTEEIKGRCKKRPYYELVSGTQE
jgi:hypothetical protein